VDTRLEELLETGLHWLSNLDWVLSSALVIVTVDWLGQHPR
jgi:hypothetical protein